MKKLKASTLVETMVAMVIIMISFGVVITFLMNNPGSKNRMRVNAYLHCEDVKSETKLKALFFDKEYDFDNMTIYKTIHDFKESKEIKILLIEAFTKDDRLIYESKDFGIYFYNTGNLTTIICCNNSPSPFVTSTTVSSPNSASIFSRKKESRESSLFAISFQTWKNR